MKQLGSFFYFVVAVCTAMIGHTIHGSLFWSIMDFIFVPMAWLKWLVCREVNVSIITQTFEFFLS